MPKLKRRHSSKQSRKRKTKGSKRKSRRVKRRYTKRKRRGGGWDKITVYIGYDKIIYNTLSLFFNISSDIHQVYSSEPLYNTILSQLTPNVKEITEKEIEDEKIKSIINTGKILRKFDISKKILEAKINSTNNNFGFFTNSSRRDVYKSKYTQYVRDKIGDRDLTKGL